MGFMEWSGIIVVYFLLAMLYLGTLMATTASDFIKPIFKKNIWCKAGCVLLFLVTVPLGGIGSFVFWVSIAIYLEEQSCGSEYRRARKMCNRRIF